MHAIVRCRTEYPCATPMQSMTTSAYIQSHSAKNSHRNWYVHRSEYSVCGHNKPQLLYIYSLQVLREWAEKWAMGESISEFFQAGFWNLSKPCLILNHWLRNIYVSSSLHFTQNIRGILHFIIINLGNVTFYVTSAVHYLHILSFDLQLLTNVRDCCVIKTRTHRYVKTFSQTCLKLKITALFVTQITK